MFMIKYYKGYLYRHLKSYPVTSFAAWSRASDGMLLAWLLQALALALLPISPISADVIFRVPEVVVRPISGTKSVGIGPSNSSRDSGSERVAEHEVDGKYEEYYIEHEVTTAAAREAIKNLSIADIPDAPPGCSTCSRRQMEYCETRVLADHCCCERHYVSEPFRWLPHTCYVGPNKCKPFARDCVRYVRLRDCCCYKMLAVRWKRIMSDSTAKTTNEFGVFLLCMLFIFGFV